MSAGFLVHLGSTLAMVGVIWTIQLVHYPLFAGVGADGFTAYESQHAQRITWIVLPLMFAELLTAGWLAWTMPAALPGWSVWAGLGLVGVIWASTGLLQVPLHNTLSGGFDAAAHERLVATNWVRTAAWTLRGGLVLWWTLLLSRSA